MRGVQRLRPGPMPLFTADSKRFSSNLGKGAVGGGGGGGCLFSFVAVTMEDYRVTVDYIVRDGEL